MPIAWIQSGNSASAGAAVTVTRAAPGAGLRHYVLGYHCSYDQTAGLGTAQVNYLDGDTGASATKGTYIANGANPGPVMFADPLDVGDNNGFQIVLAGSGTANGYVMIFGVTG